jgi:hypothetical protein
MFEAPTIRLYPRMALHLHRAAPEALRPFACACAAIARDLASPEDPDARLAITSAEQYAAHRATAAHLAHAQEALRPKAEALKTAVAEEEAEVCAGRGSVEQLLRRKIHLGAVATAFACTLADEKKAAAAAIASANSLVNVHSQLQTQQQLLQLASLYLAHPQGDSAPPQYPEDAQLARQLPAWIAKPILRADTSTLRRFCCQCGRLLLEVCRCPDPRSLRSVEVAERYVQGEATPDNLAAAHAQAAEAERELEQGRDYSAAPDDIVAPSLPDSGLVAEAASLARMCCEADIRPAVAQVVATINLIYDGYLYSVAKQPLESAVREFLIRAPERRGSRSSRPPPP